MRPIPWPKLAIITAAAGAAAIALALYLTAGGGDLGRPGEWVTRPDGRKVCRLARPLTPTSKIDTGFCDDWQEPEPRRGEPVDGWIRRAENGSIQIMIEGTWRP